MKFNANVVVDAIVNAAKADGAFVRAMVEQREAAGKGFKADAAVLAIAESLAARVNAGELDAACIDTYVSNARKMCECSMAVLIAACEEGYGRNGVCRRITAMVGAKGKGGRPPGQGKGKTTKPTEDKAQAEPETVPNDDAAWLRFINDMRSKVNGRKDWPADRIVAFQDTTATLIALLKSVQK